MPDWSTFAAATAVLLTAALWALRSLERGRGHARVPIAFVVIATAAGLFLARAATLDAAPLLEGELLVGDEGLRIPPHEAAEVVALHGVPPQGSRVAYTVSVQQDAQEIARPHGVFESHVTRRSLGRGASAPMLSAHTDTRFTLPPSAVPQSVSLVRLSGEIAAPVHARVLPAPPSTPSVVAAALAAGVGGVVVDALAGGATGLAVFGPFVGLFALVETTGLTPDSGVRAPLVAGFGSFLVASLVGPGLRRALRAVLAARRG